jgi:predicted transcriptional regulator
MADSEPTQPRTVRLPDDLWHWLHVRAAEQDRSTAWVIRDALTKYRAEIERERPSQGKGSRRRQS